MNETVNLNAQISQGFRLGGVNDPLNETLCNASDRAVFGGFQDYDDETLINYEFGMKAASRGWTANVAAFYTDIEDLQVTLDAGSCSSRISFNVDKAFTQGIEFDSSGNVIGGVEKGNRLASVPELQFAFATTYTFDSPLFNSKNTYLSASYQYVGDRITQPSDQVAGAGSFTSGLPFGGATGTETTNLDLLLDAYQTLNLSMGFEYDNWEALLYVNNVLDENANLSFDRERGGRARLAYRTNQPRTVGVTFRYFY
jgi:outer membrane receptor protein involved in Fe transport